MAIDKCNKIAKKEGIHQRQTYSRERKRLLREIYNGKHLKGAQKARKVQKRLKTIAACQLRELERKMSESQNGYYRKEFEKYTRVITWRKNDRDKLYSLHKPFIKCISKGKAHKPYEFGNKVGLICGGKKGKKIILAIQGFVENVFDGHTIEPLLNQLFLSICFIKFYGLSIIQIASNLTIESSGIFFLVAFSFTFSNH